MPSRTPIADQILQMGASERNPTWGEMFMQLGRAKARIVELEAEVARYRGDLLNLPGLVSEFARDKPRELVEVMEAAGVIEASPTDPRGWRLVGFQYGLPAGETSQDRIGPALAERMELIRGNADDNDDDVVDAEVVE